MQINRLFQIVYILINKGMVTASELAEKFEVSNRTIYRDIDVLSSAGIPVYTSKGKGGGIGLLDQFVLNKSLLSEKEQEEVLVGLQCLTVTGFTVDSILSKLSTLFCKENLNWIEVDFSSWGSGEYEKNKYALLKSAILNSKMIQFDYYNANGEKSTREVEPMQFLFKNRAWYINGFCLARRANRIFKISRIKNLKITEIKFDRGRNNEKFENEMTHYVENNAIHIKLKIDHYFAFRVYDEFRRGDITKNDDGSFDVNIYYAEDEWLYSYLLSFGCYAEVIEPEYIRNELIKKLEQSIKIYKPI